jgi:virginiamycin B lyase
VTPGEPVSTVRIDDVAIARLTIPGYVDFLAADGRSVWATNEDRVERLQVDQASPVATIAVPGPCGGMVVFDGSLWVASCTELSVVRIDRVTGEVVARIPTGLADPTGELSLAAGAGSVWVLSGAEGALSRVDAATNEVSGVVSVAPDSYCAAFSDGFVWITNSGAPGDAASGSVQRIDPVGPAPRFLAAGEGSAWTLNWGDGSVSRVGVGSNHSVSIPLRMEGGGGDIDVGAGRVWVRGNEVLLACLDPATNEVTTIYGPPAGSGAVRVADDLVWVTAHDTNTVWVLPAHSDGAARAGVDV